MSDQYSVRYLIDGIGDKYLTEITQDELDMLTSVINDIKDHPHRGKVIYDYVYNYKNDNIHKGNVINCLLEACEEIEIIEENKGSIISLESLDECDNSFKILEIPERDEIDKNNKGKAIIYASGIESSWGTGKGITNDQLKFLKSIRITQIKWFKIVEDQYIPMSKKYINIDLLPIVPPSNTNNKEAMLMCASMFGVIALCSLDFSNNRSQYSK